MGPSYVSAGSLASEGANVRSETDTPSKSPYLPEMVITENLFQFPHGKLHSVCMGHARQPTHIHVSSDVVCHLIANAALLVGVYLQRNPPTLIQGQDEVRVGRPWWHQRY